MAYFPQAYRNAMTAAQVAASITFEIEGWPTAYANGPLNGGVGAWFSTAGIGDGIGGQSEPARPINNRPTAVKQLFKQDPSGQMQDFGLGQTKLDLLKSSASMGGAKVSLVDLDGTLASLAGLRLPVPGILPANLLYGMSAVDVGLPVASSPRFLYLAPGCDTAPFTTTPAPSHVYVGRECFKLAASGTNAYGNFYLEVYRCALQGPVAAPIGYEHGGQNLAGMQPSGLPNETLTCTSSSAGPPPTATFAGLSWDVNACAGVTAIAPGGVLWDIVSNTDHVLTLAYSTAPGHVTSGAPATGAGWNIPVGTGAQLGDLVSIFPRHLIDRKVWIRLGYNATCDADCVTVFAGYIRDFGWEDGGRTLSFNLEDAQNRMKRALFSDLATRWFPQGVQSQPQITAADFNVAAPLGNLNTPGGAINVNMSGVPSGIAFEPGEIVFGVVENQPFCFRFVGPYEYQGAIMPGVWSFHQPQNITPMWSLIETSSFAFTLHAFRPFIMIAAGLGDTDSTDSPRSDVWPSWVGAIVNGQTVWMTGNHVLAVLLAVLTSTGSAANMGSSTQGAESPGYNGPADWLPAEWGLGIPVSDIDVAGIVAVYSNASSRLVNVPIFDVVKDAREWLVSLLRPFGYSLMVNSIGQIAVVSMDQSDPDQVADFGSLADTDLALDSAGQPLMISGPVCSGGQRLVSVKWSDSPFVRDGKLELRKPFTIQVEDQAAAQNDPVALAGSIEPIVIEAPGLDSWIPDVDIAQSQPAPNGFWGGSLTGVSFFHSRWDNGGITNVNGQLPVLARLLADLTLRFGGAPFVLTVETWLRKSMASVGDFLALSFPFLPNPFTGARGISGVNAQLTGRKVNLLKGTVEMELTIFGAPVVHFMAPSLVLTGWTAGSKTAAITDSPPTYSATGMHDTDSLAVAGALVVGIAIVVYATGTTAATCGKSGPCVVDSITGSTVVLHTAPTITMLDGTTARAPAAGDVIRLAPYASQPAAAKARYTWQADPATNLLGGTDPADTWSNP